MDNILITRSNGFLGSHLIDKCIDENYIVYGLDRSSSSFRLLIIDKQYKMRVKLEVK